MSRQILGALMLAVMVGDSRSRTERIPSPSLTSPAQRLASWQLFASPLLMNSASSWTNRKVHSEPHPTSAESSAQPSRRRPDSMFSSNAVNCFSAFSHGSLGGTASIPSWHVWNWNTVSWSR